MRKLQSIPSRMIRRAATTWSWPSVLMLALIVGSAFIAPAEGRAQFRVLASAGATSAFERSSALMTPTVRPSAQQLAEGVVPSSNSAPIPGQKNPIVAAGLSLILPGLGEYYVGEQLWRGVLFTGIEVGLWAGRAHWQQRYDDSGAAFYAFTAHHWDTGRYVRYLDSQLVANHVSQGCNCFPDSSDVHSLNRAIAKLDSLASSSTDPYATDDFTHRLAIGDPQQWNELLSKYNEFLPGWDDPSRFLRAGEMRANWNSQAGIADAFLYGIFLNHVLSAIDAALLASDHNIRIRLQGSLERHPGPGGTLGYAPTASVRVTF